MYFCVSLRGAKRRGNLLLNDTVFYRVCLYNSRIGSLPSSTLNNSWSKSLIRFGVILNMLDFTDLYVSFGLIIPKLSFQSFNANLTLSSPDICSAIPHN